MEHGETKDLKIDQQCFEIRTSFLVIKIEDSPEFVWIFLEIVHVYLISEHICSFHAIRWRSNACE